MDDVDWYDRRRSAIWTGVCGLIAAAAAVVGDHRIVVLSPVWPVLGGVACAAVSVVVGIRNEALPAGIFRAVAWLAASGWVGWCYHYGPWFANTLLALIVGTVVLAVVSLALPMPDGPNLPVGPDQMSVQAPAPDAVAWEQRLAKVADVSGCTVTAVEQWPTAAGYDVHGDGADWVKVKAQERALATSLRLPPGCGVEVGPGPHSAAFVVRVNTVDTLAVARAYTDTSPLSGNAPLPLGWHRDGTPAEMTMRRTCSLVVAATDGGKSNLLHALTANYVRCPDVLVWHIDLGGAGLALPWLAPWLDGQMEHPVIDWAATTVEEAVRMTDFALQVIGQRRRIYRQLMAQENTDIVPCSPRVPQIRIINDETAEAAGTTADPRLKANIIRIIQLGRVAGIRFDLSALRAVETVLPMDALRQLGLRAVFGVQDAAEVGYALGWTVKVNPAETTHPGVGWWRPSLAHPVRVFRSLHTALPDTISRLAAACEPYRPRLDEPSLNVPLRAAYESRWQRVVPLLSDDSEPAHERRSPAVSGGGSLPARDDLTAGLARFDRNLGRARAAKMPPREVEAKFAELAEQFEDERATGSTVQPASPDAEPPGDAKARMLELLDAAGPEGMSGLAVARALAAEGHTMSQRTVYRWLEQHAVDGGRGSFRHAKYREAGS